MSRRNNYNRTRQETANPNENQGQPIPLTDEQRRFNDFIRHMQEGERRYGFQVVPLIARQESLEAYDEQGNPVTEIRNKVTRGFRPIPGWQKPKDQPRQNAPKPNNDQSGE